MTLVTVHKLNGRGESTVQYEAEVVERLADGVRLEARWTRPALDLGYTRFEPGDRFVEWFFCDRWYNIFEIHTGATGALKGWYCNVAAPATIEAYTVAARDLVLDLWVAADGTTQVLDEDEFAADTTMDAATRAGAEAGLRALLELVAALRPPFDAIV
jgi:predicted RNA-binding protein associated with RNAse of E/G family